jgi:protein SCO1/2
MATRVGKSLVRRIARQPILWIFVVGTLFALPLVRSIARSHDLPTPPPIYQTVPNFTLTDETGATFSRAKLDGQVWIANFIFTSCPTACPLLSKKMEKIQKRTRNLGRSFHMVSFSVDPEHDTPAELDKYARRFHANPRGWNFLTGPLDQVKTAVTDGFKIYFAKEKREDADPSATDFFQIVHGEHIVLVDQKQRIRGYYVADDDGIDQLMADVALLVNQGPEPLVAAKSSP